MPISPVRRWILPYPKRWTVAGSGLFSAPRVPARLFPAGLIPACLILACLVPAGPVLAYRTFYANLHSHCALSDGIGTPQEAYTYARDVAGIDVLALTDHTHLLTTAEFNTLLSVAEQYTQPGVFVALGAQEFGNLNDFGHMNIYAAPTRNPRATEDLLGAYAFIVSSGAFASFNHPNPDYGTNFNNLEFYPEHEEAMRAIEIRNGMAYDDYQAQYVQALSNGWKIGPFAGQDNHEGHWGDQGNPNMGNAIYLTGILADSLTRPEILSALRARRFFAMEIDPPSDRMELDFRVDGHPMGSVVTTDINPRFTATVRAANGVGLFNRIELYRDGAVYRTHVQIGTEISFEAFDVLADGEAHHYFVRARQVDGDFAWSSPVWVTAAATTVSVAGGENDEALPRFLSSVPNPAERETELRFVLPAGLSRVHITIHDGAGRLVRDLGERTLPAGPHRWAWDGRDSGGDPVPSGVYLSRLTAGGREARTGRLVLLR